VKCCKQEAPDSGSEGRNWRDTQRADSRETGETKTSPRGGCVDRSNKCVARNRYANRGQDSI
jgi:hypothetical protein